LINVSLLDTQEERLTAAEAAVIARSVRENRYREEIRKILGEIRAAAAEGSYKLSFEGIISTETHANLVSRGFKVATRSDRNEGWVDISWG
jgi:methylmalonyl-CoA mutase cobalamin-binding subunit